MTKNIFRLPGRSPCDQLLLQNNNIFLCFKKGPFLKQPSNYIQIWFQIVFQGLLQTVKEADFSVCMNNISGSCQLEGK